MMRTNTAMILQRLRRKPGSIKMSNPISKTTKKINKRAMPWYNGNFPPSYKNQPIPLREKAVEIANQLLEQGTDEGIAIATGLKQARLFFKKQATMPTDKKYVDAFHEYDDFMFKKRQYAKAMHVFHDQTADYHEII